MEELRLRCRLCNRLVRKLGPKWVRIGSHLWPVCEDCAALSDDETEDPEDVTD